LFAGRASIQTQKLATHTLEVTNNHGDTLSMHLLSLLLCMVFFCWNWYWCWYWYSI